MPSALEEQFAVQLRALRLPEAQREYVFAKPRRWRFDFAWPDLMVAIEVEGGTWSGGRHTRGSGFEADLQKYNTALMNGWAVLRFSGTMVKSGEAARLAVLALNMRAAA
jgi:very-short-patch-repair endonuclease